MAEKAPRDPQGLADLIAQLEQVDEVGTPISIVENLCTRFIGTNRKPSC